MSFGEYFQVRQTSGVFGVQRELHIFVFWCDESSLKSSNVWLHSEPESFHSNPRLCSPVFFTPSPLTPSRCWRFLLTHQMFPNPTEDGSIQTHCLYFYLSKVWFTDSFLYIFSKKNKKKMGWLWLTGCQEITVVDLGLFTGFDDNKKKQKSSLSSLNAPSIWK